VDRHVLDASVLIDLKKARQVRLLTNPIARGKIVVPSYVLNSLRKSSRWRTWIQRNELRVRATFQTTAEHELFATLVVKHGSYDSNPRVAADDIQAITIASCRSLPLAMRDRPAEAIARGLGVRVLTLDDLLNQLAGRPPVRLL
jgi:uncharacterized protein YacL